LPRHRAERHAARFALAVVELPLKRKSDLIQVVATKAAIMDAGIAWLMELIVECAGRRRNSQFLTLATRWLWFARIQFCFRVTRQR
jgi:hypothetical protein